MKKKLTNKFTDIHHHILYGLDDGAATPEKMQEMLRKAAEDNIGRIIATPHVTPGVKRFERDQFDRALRAAQEYSAGENLNIEIYEGCEILYTDQTPRFLEEGRIPTLADTDLVLVEFSPDVQYKKLVDALESILTSGFSPIVAHVERYDCLAHHPSRAEKLKDEMDVYFQVNCTSIIGDKKGMGNKKFVEKLLDKDLIDAIGTDAHSPNKRPVRMMEAWQKLKKDFGKSYANELTDGHLLFEYPAGE